LRHARPLGDHALKGRRPAFFAEAGGFVEAAVYDRYRLGPGASFQGPAIVEERESTAVIGPGGRCRVDDHLLLLVELRDRASRGAAELPQARAPRGER